MQYDSLNTYSQKVLEFISNHYPDLTSNLSLKPDNEGKFFLELKINHPLRSSWNIYLVTEDDEVTVCFDDFHWHFNRFSETDFNEELKDALQVITEITNDQLLVLYYSKGKAFAKSKLMDSQKVRFLNEKGLLEKELAFWTTLKVVSWSGSHDDVLIKAYD